MTVAELIEELERMPQDLPVFVPCWMDGDVVETYQVTLLENSVEVTGE